MATSTPTIPVTAPASTKDAAKGQAEPAHHDRMGVAAGGQECRVAEAWLSGMTREQHQAHAGDGPDQDVGGLADQEIVQKKWQREREDQERSVAQGVPRIREQANVVLVAGLEMHPHRLRPSWRGPGRGCREGG